MIVRIAGEGRWHVPDGRSGDLLREDFLLARAVHDEREADYRHRLLAICRYVRRHGQRLAPSALGADLTIPSPEMTLAETADLLAEHPGLPAGGQSIL
jgi:hypothetical protein